MGLSKDRMLEALPVCERALTLRRWTRADTYARAKWPSYPSEYKDFNFTLSGASQAELDRRFLVRGRAKWASDGRVKVCHLRQGVCHRVGSWIPGAGITEELARGEPTQDGNRNFNTDTA